MKFQNEQNTFCKALKVIISTTFTLHMYLEIKLNQVSKQIPFIMCVSTSNFITSGHKYFILNFSSQAEFFLSVGDILTLRKH